MAQVHNKLVRDRIPEIIESKGEIAVTDVLGDEAYLDALLGKIAEESLEIARSDNDHLLEELGDLETLVDALLKVKGWTREDLLTQQKAKDEERGTFEKRIFLVESKVKDE